MFEKAYGSGRGDDISNMLLSFAGKALKPEATVKSSFGEFFEEEAENVQANVKNIKTLQPQLRSMHS